MTEYKYRIWGLLTYVPPNWTNDPSGINYKTEPRRRLHKVLEMVSGQLVTAKYYWVNEDGEITDEQVVQVDFKWIRDEKGHLTRQERRYRWVTTEGEFGPHEKNDFKLYIPKEAAKADKRRRENIVGDLESQSELFGVEDDLKLMLRDLDKYKSTYISMNDREIVSQIATYVGDWLEDDASKKLPHLPTGTTLRQIVMSELNYAD